MKRLTLVFLILAFCATAFAGESQLQKATNVVNEIMGTPDKGIPDELLEKAVCVGIVPSELKFALGFGGTYGRGMLVCRNCTSPIAISSIGRAGGCNPVPLPSQLEGGALIVRLADLVAAHQRTSGR